MLRSGGIAAEDAGLTSPEPGRRSAAGSPGINTARPGRPRAGRSRFALRIVAVAYVLMLVLAPVIVVLWRTFSEGASAFVDALSSENTIAALRLTAEVATISVVINTVFGVGVGMLLARYEFPGKRILDVLIDLPVSVSPIVVGLALILVYGSTTGWFGGALDSIGFQVIFATPGIALATTFVSLPLVLREVVPVLVEAGTDQEQAARSLGANAWQRFWRITLPTIRWALAYGVVLSVARSVGEFGAVKVVSGNILGQTQTLTTEVDGLAEQFEPGYYQISLVLIAISVICITVISLLKPKKDI
jgi:sulfate/thiosulfate transport system permease protein